jgi:hypothetical protein
MMPLVELHKQVNVQDRPRTPLRFASVCLFKSLTFVLKSLSMDISMNFGI